MQNIILKKFFTRLSSILITVIIFWLALIYWIVQIKSAEQVSTLVERETSKYEKTMANVDGDEAHQGAIKKILESRTDLLAVEVVKKSKELLFKGLDDKLDSEVKSAFFDYKYGDGEFKYEAFTLKKTDEIVLLFTQKLKTKDFDGYIKAVVKVDKSVTDDLEKGVYYIFAIVISTILMVVFTIFPLIYKQYRKLNIEKYRLLRSNVDIISALGQAVAKRDSDTSEHNYRVTIYSIKLAIRMGLSNKKMKGLIKGAFLHDVGKIGITDNILLKPGKLLEKEFEVMKTHVNLGLEIVDGIHWLFDAKRVIGYHHEKVNGSGYPHGVTGDNIPIEAKIFAVVDVFDALTSKRPYKEALDVQRSIDIINQDVNSHFDEEVVFEFNEIAKELYAFTKNKTQKELKIYLEEIGREYFAN